jgi:hypothetical protein
VVILLCSVIYNSAFCADEYQRRSLKGIKAIYVVVENLPDEVEKDGLTIDQITTDVKLKVGMAGIKVVSLKEPIIILGSPYLYINLYGIMIPNVQIFSYNFEVSLKQIVSLVRNPNITFSTSTWVYSKIGYVGADKIKQIRETIKDAVDIFINDYLAENPK